VVYAGSLNFPPCVEDTLWVVDATVDYVDKWTFASVRGIIRVDNVRTWQDANDRIVVREVEI